MPARTRRTTTRPGRWAALALTALTALASLAAPAPAGATLVPDRVLREDLLTVADYTRVFPELRDPLRVVVRARLFAPRECEDQALLVAGETRIEASLSTVGRRRSVSLITQNVLRFESVRQARALLRRYRHFSEECVGNVGTDDGEGGAVTLKNRSWYPRRVGDQSTGMLVGWFQGGNADWRRVLAVRTGRTVSVIDVGHTDIRPPREKVLELGRLAVDRIG